MINDKIRPTQPYMVLDSDRFIQEVYQRQGISHFYQCTVHAGTVLRIVPTGCIDICFIYYRDDHTMRVCVQGTYLKYTERTEPENVEVFGVRMLPGFHPSFLKYEMAELLNKIVEVDAGDFPRRLLRRMYKANAFYDRVKVFLEEYTSYEEKETSFGKRELLDVVKETAYRKNGSIEIASLEEKTGYTPRYINKVFVEAMGVSPKIFCKILQFQHAIEFLNYGSLAWSYGKIDDDLPTRMADIATFLGYYDQPQFIRDFKKYAGITPKRYLDMVCDGAYRMKTHSSDLYNSLSE